MTRPLLIVALSMVVAGAATPQSAVDELLAADRAFAAASAATDLVSGLTAMFADEVAIPMPPGQFVDGKTAVVAALRADAGRLAAAKASLDQAERAFSSEAQRIGLGPAFARFGSADAINLGRPDDAAIVTGAANIARMVGQGLPEGTSPVSWAPERVIVASSGDLGVTIGWIVPNQPTPDRPAKSPFFTIWRRPSPTAPWLYIAE